MIFLYTINNTDVLPSRPHSSGFVMKWLSPPPSKQGPWEHQFGPPPPFPPPTCATEQVFKKSIRTVLGWKQIMLATPQGEGSPELWVTTVIWKTQWRRVATARWASEMLLAGADCRICMHRLQESVCLSCPADNVPDKIMHWLSKKNWLFKH